VIAERGAALKIQATPTDRWRWLEWAAAALAALNGLVVAALFAQSQPDLLPLPGLYLQEIALLGPLLLAGLFFERPKWRLWPELAWGTAGVLLAFVVLGMWTIGLFLIPAFCLCLLAGWLGSRRLGRPIGRQVGLLALAAVCQAALMLVFVVTA
jgi:hypothetical protein